MRVILTVLSLLWLAAIAASAWSLVVPEPNGDGFTRGLNRVMAFAGFQCAAAVVAAVLWVAGRRLPAGSLRRWLSRIPLLLALSLTLFVVATIVSVNLAKPEPESLPQTGSQPTACGSDPCTKSGVTGSP